MCLIVFAYNCHPAYHLILGANRDEFRNRPTDPAEFWSNAPHILAGRDRVAGGTWLGVTTDGKLAAITNYRSPQEQGDVSTSRGRLVSAYLQNPLMTPGKFQSLLNHDGAHYKGLNLLYGTATELHYFTNRGGSSGPVTPGIHGLSNHLLDTRWPKVAAATSRLESVLQDAQVDPDQIFAALADPTPFPVDMLPDTGVGPDRERLLSPIFIDNESYGTRSTTVLLISRSGLVTFMERTFDRSPSSSTLLRYSFQVRLPIS
ncbi:MAG: NRDE family protein [Desulfuromonadaceae bacterium]|nr:NRDE family protein [Desulfuromonadaceae bacterium]